MTRTSLAAEAWRAWVRDKPFQSEDTAKGFMEGFNFCLIGKIKVEGGDKGKLISENFSLQDKIIELEQGIEALRIRNGELAGQKASLERSLGEAKKLLSSLLYVYQLGKNELAIARVRLEAEQFLKEVANENEINASAAKRQ